MENIDLVTRHLKKIILQNGGDVKRETLNVIKATDGKLFYEASDGKVYRVYDFVENTISLNLPENAKQFEASAKAFGKFQNMLSDFDASMLYESIPDFHNTVRYLAGFKKAVLSVSQHRFFC